MSGYQPFHQQLRRERERHNWSQADVAEKLGVDVKTVNRWEKGSRKPLPYYRQKLCQLFNKSPEEFGLFENVNHDQAITSPLAAIHPQTSNTSESASTSTSLLSERHLINDSSSPLHHSLHADWGEAPHTGRFYGRMRELDMLTEWIIDDYCRLVAVLGMGGVGKTTLTAELVQQVQEQFKYIFWRSLQNAPPLEHILQQCIQFVSGQQRADLPKSIDEQISLLIQYLRDHRCLLVLDNAESILQVGERAGQYQKGYESYGILLQRVGEVQHMSCLLLTSREKPREVVRLEGKTLPVRSLHLHGIGYVEGQELLKEKDIFGSHEQWKALIDLYSGNPLALQLVSGSIEGVFEGDIARFLAEKEFTFGDINDLLDQQFLRLSTREQEILYWLAIEREAVPLQEIREDFVRSPSKGELLEALDSLQRRTLIETRGAARFILQPVILEYVTRRLIKQVYEEFIGVAETTIGVWTNYALIQAHTRDYVRDSQMRLILGPVAEQLLDTLGKDGIEQKLRDWLYSKRQVPSRHHSYLAGNALNLLIYLDYDLRGSDFSSLTIRQAYLQNVALPEVNFANALFEASVFTNTFGNIHTVAFSPRGELLATGTATGDIWIYQAPGGTPLLNCRGHTDGVWSVAFSSDGHLLASSSDDQTIRLWDVGTGQCLKILQGHTNRVRAIAFSPNNMVLASGSDDKTIRLWAVSTGYCFKTLHGHADRVWSIAFSPDGNVLASGSTDQTIHLWDVSTDYGFKTLQGHTQGVRSLAFSPDGNFLVSGGDDQTVRLWDVSVTQCVKVFRGHTNRVWSVAFSPDGQTLASGSEDRVIRLWDVDSSLCLKILQNHVQGIRSVAFSPDIRILASGGDDQAVRLWDVGTGYCLKTLQGYTNRIRCIAFSPDGSMLVSASEDQTIRLWHFSTGHCFCTLQDRTHLVRWVAFSPDERTIISGGGDQTVRLWDISSGRCFYILQGHTNWVWAVAFSPDGQTIASGGEDQTVRLWDVSSRHCLYALQGHTSWVRSVAFSPNGAVLASGSDDQTIKLWEIHTGRCLKTLEDHTGRVRSVAFDPNGHTLASGSEDQTVRLWDITTASCLRTLQGHTNWVRSVAFSPNGNTLASSGDDQTIRLWEVSSGHCLHILRGHANRIRSITFRSDGQTLASADDDGMIKIWDTRTAETLKTFSSERPYEHMNITSVSGLTEAQKAALKLLGAIEEK